MLNKNLTIVSFKLVKIQTQIQATQTVAIHRQVHQTVTHQIVTLKILIPILILHPIHLTTPVSHLNPPYFMKNLTEN